MGDERRGEIATVNDDDFWMEGREVFDAYSDHTDEDPCWRRNRELRMALRAPVEQIEYERIETEARGLLNKLIVRRPRRGRPAQGQSLARDKDAAIALLQQCSSQQIAPSESLVTLFRFLNGAILNRLTRQQLKAVAIDARYFVKNNGQAPALKLARAAEVSAWTVYKWRRLPAYQKEFEARVSSHLTERLRNHPAEAVIVDRIDRRLVKLRAEATSHWKVPFRSPQDPSKLIRSPEEWAKYMLDHGLQFAPSIPNKAEVLQTRAMKDAVRGKWE
jgi:hypothetical protein